MSAVEKTTVLSTVTVLTQLVVTIATVPLDIKTKAWDISALVCVELNNGGSV